VNQYALAYLVRSREMTMIGSRPLLPFAPFLLSGAAARCTQKNTGDEPATANDVPTGLTRFLLFPNRLPRTQAGSRRTHAYAMVLPAPSIRSAQSEGHARKVEAANGFGSGTAPNIWPSSAIPRISIRPG